MGFSTLFIVSGQVKSGKSIIRLTKIVPKAPAQSAIKHVNIVSNSSLGHDSDPYTGPPTPERDALWEGLYNCELIFEEFNKDSSNKKLVGLSKIPLESAAQLVNRTVPIPGDPGQYIVSLDVFHELHCLVSHLQV